MLIRDAHKMVEQEATIEGWMYNKRGGKGLWFLQLRDGTGTMQAVVEEQAVSAEVYARAEELTMESSVKVTGKVVAHPKREGVFEMQVVDIEIVCLSPDDYPISKKEHGPDFLLEHRHLWLRSAKQLAIQRVRDQVFRGIVEYYHQNGFIRIDTPILTTNACEGSTELFEVDYFGEPAYLAQSGQLYLEAAIMSCGRGYDFGPVFRSEKSKTRRHLTEFWMMDAEMAFCDLEGSLKIQEEMVVHVVMRVLQNCQNELSVLERDIEALKSIKGGFKRMTHAEAVEVLQSRGSDITMDRDLGGDDEGLLMEGEAQPVFVTHYPTDVKAFYMKQDGKGHALCADLLAPEGFGEIIGGSQREDDLEALLASMDKFEVSTKGLEWYIDLRRYGSVPHSGFGVGLERLTGWMCGTKHIRETIPFPRLINRLRP
jgi:asparaginyl-tRNA synthetase